MIPKSIKKLLVNCWHYSEEEVEKVGLADHYLVWVCGIDNIVDRTKTPDALEIITDFKRYTLLTNVLKEQTLINWKDDIDFFYNMTNNFINNYYGNETFELRIVRIPDSLYYIEFKLDERYSFVYQQVWYPSEEELGEMRDTQTFLNKSVKVPFNKVFNIISVASDMVL